jgi:hypothetical protein
MNAICPFCGEPQHYSVIWMDTVVPCGSCGREFLLSNYPRDQAPRRPWSPASIRTGFEIFIKVTLLPVRTFLHWWLVD